MKDGRRQRGAATRKRIVQASLVLIARDGLVGLTGAALSREAGVSKATVFHHFPTLDQVPLAALDHVLEGLVAAFQHHESARGYLLQAGRDVLRLTAEGEDEALVMNALLTSAGQHPELKRRMASLSMMYRDQMATELLALAPHAAPERAREVADIAVTAIDGLATHLALTGEKERLERAWDQLVESLLVLLGSSGPNTERSA